MRRIAAVLIVGVVFTLARCRCEDSLNDLVPKIVVTPAAIDMGERTVAAASTSTFTIGNEGSAPLHVSKVSIEAADEPPAGAIDASGATFTVDPLAASDVGIGARMDATLRFTPPTRGVFAATLVVTADDPDRRIVRVPVQGTGGPPRIAASPSPLDFGTVNEGPGALQAVLVTNTGYDTLVIAELALRDGDRGFSLPVDAPRAATLAPGASISVAIQVDPRRELVLATTDGVLRDALTIDSDAENAPLLEVPIQARVNLAPQAVAVELVTRRTEYKTGVGREVTIDGKDTVDPEGDAFTMSWSLPTRPTGSAAILAGTLTAGDCTDDAQCDVTAGYRCTDTGTRKCRQIERTRVTPDAVGEYVVRLRATDAFGAFSEADVRILPRDLALVLTWYAEANAPCHAYTPAQCAAMTTDEQRTLCCGQSDVDLHFIRPAGTLGDYGACPASCRFDQTSDAGTITSVDLCFEDGDANQATCRQQGSDVAYANRYPEWANAGRADDPRLDLDDVRGDGPEITSLDEPADGEYLAVVHYCTDRIGEPTVATVQVYVKGVLTGTAGPQLLDAEGRAWVALRLVRSGGPQDGTWAITPQLNVFDGTAPADLCLR